MNSWFSIAGITKEPVMRPSPKAPSWQSETISSRTDAVVKENVKQIYKIIWLSNAVNMAKNSGWTFNPSFGYPAFVLKAGVSKIVPILPDSGFARCPNRLRPKTDGE
jgi:hypothetical protein